MVVLFRVHKHSHIDEFRVFILPSCLWTRNELNIWSKPTQTHGNTEAASSSSSNLNWKLSVLTAESTCQPVSVWLHSCFSYTYVILCVYSKTYSTHSRDTDNQRGFTHKHTSTHLTKWEWQKQLLAWSGGHVGSQHWGKKQILSPRGLCKLWVTGSHGCTRLWVFSSVCVCVCVRTREKVSYCVSK